VQGYLDKINKFERGRSLKELHVDDIDRKELVIYIEKNKTTAAQRQQLNGAKACGTLVGVTVKIVDIVS
jgi:hypothetical protein